MKIKNKDWAIVESCLTVMRDEKDRLGNATEGLLIAPESPLLSCFGRVSEACISALESLIRDKDRAITWFVYECDFGRNQLDAGIGNDMRIIDSFEKLRWFIELTNPELERV